MPFLRFGCCSVQFFLRFAQFDVLILHSSLSLPLLNFFSATA
jgi:hypothetical protein